MIRGTKVYFGDAARDLERMEWDLAHPGLRWSDVGIPLRETHAHDPPRYPHRSVWRLTHHKGDDCVWARVRIRPIVDRQWASYLLGRTLAKVLFPHVRHAQEPGSPGGVVPTDEVRHTG